LWRRIGLLIFSGVKRYGRDDVKTRYDGQPNNPVGCALAGYFGEPSLEDPRALIGGAAEVRDRRFWEWWLAVDGAGVRVPQVQAQAGKGDYSAP